MNLLNPILTKIKQKKIVLICFAISIMCLALGVIPYLFVITSNTYVSSFFELFFDLRKIPINENSVFYQILTSFYADACWAFAMPFFLYAFTGGRFHKHFYMFIMPVIGSVLELFQFLGIMYGVGDFIDVSIYFVGSILGFIVMDKGVLKWQIRPIKKKCLSE